MNRTAVGLGKGWTKAARLAAVALAGGLLAAGCRAGGGGGGDATGISATDEHGNLFLEATLITPGGKSDGANVRGQINYPGDVDWFVFRGIQGVGYVLQVTGFPPNPDVRPDLDLTGDGTRVLIPAIQNVLGATQLVNTAGTAGGIPSDINPAGMEGTEGFVVIGDSRFMWVCPTTNAQFAFAIFHEREQTGIGAYEVRVASSQLMTVDSSDTIFQSGARFVFIADDSGVWFSDFMWGGLQYTFLEYEEAIDTTENGFVFLISDLVFRPDNDTPEPVVVHAHRGFPNNFVQELSTWTFVNDHERFAEVQFDFSRSRSPGDVVAATGSGKLPDGTEFRFPVEARIVENAESTPAGWYTVEAKVDFEEIATERGICCGGSDGFDFDGGVVRTFTGFDWYMDLHPQPDVEEIDPVPLASSRPLGDIYQVFETHFEMSQGNVVRADGSRIPEDERGFLAFILYYDAALKLFQVATQEFQYSPNYPYPGFFIDPDYSSFVGDRVRVHAGGPGEVGPMIIDLGTLPGIAGPPTVRLPSLDTVAEEPGFRAPVRQLTDSEALELRETYYDTGFYMEVTDRFSGEPLLRAESDIFEISFFDELEPCSFPPCSGLDPMENSQKGTATFASALAGEGPVDVYVNGELIGSLSETVSAGDLPGCGVEGDNRTVATEIWPETYYWHAHGKNGKTWDGHVTVTGGACNLVVIGPDDEKQD